ncbi:MAG TPA: 16S rRNA (guanine(966)-N(2))-methyltransferase RsmD [Gelria sp.]|nr:16S rRNA (guanine(966)-N(2))-methyltransferase RsmD [Gelria sp.]
MRVISGTARGKRLKAPRGTDTRPITDMIKEALFNVIGDNIVGASLLDLFAGSGSVGIEALSRGAQMVIFIDNHIKSVNTIRENLSNCGFKEDYELYRNDVFRALEILRQRQIKFDYIYADPPFTVPGIFSPFLAAMDDYSSLLTNEGNLILRSPRKMGLTVELNQLEEYRSDNYGESTLHYYCLNKEVIRG